MSQLGFMEGLDRKEGKEAWDENGREVEGLDAEGGTEMEVRVGEHQVQQTDLRVTCKRYAATIYPFFKTTTEELAEVS